MRDAGDRNETRKANIALAMSGIVLMLAIAVPAGAEVNLVCPLCDHPAQTVISVSAVVDLVVATLIRHGVSILFLGALAIVGLPWLIAGVAIAVLYAPRWLRGGSPRA